MKPRPIALAVVAACLPFTLCAVAPGDSSEAVVAELGAPSGTATVGSNTIWFFARGEVKLRDGRVVAANLVSVEDLTARQAAETAAILRMEEAAQARLARLEAEGRAVYAAKKVDANFATLPADAQLSYWRSFASRYPMVSVAAEIAPLAERVGYELRLRELAAANEARLAEIEQRVENAEDRAARAEREARRDRYYGNGYRFGGQPARPRHPPHHDDRPPPPNSESRTTPPLNPVDAARADAMAEIEANRQRAYNGGGR